MHITGFSKQFLLMCSIAALSACGGSSKSTLPTTQEPTTDLSEQNPVDPDGNGEGGDGNNSNGDSGGDGSNNTAGNGNPTNGGTPGTDGDGNPVSEPQAFERLPSGGHVINPQFQWTPVEGASSYRLIIEDHRGDRISQQLSAQEANCLDTSVACQFTPSVQIHDSILKWRVQSFDAAGVFIETNDDVAYNTRRSTSAQPFTSLDNPDAPPNPGNGYPTLQYDQFLVLNNDWGKDSVNNDNWKQTVSVDRLANGNAAVVFEYDWLTQSDGNEYAVKSYPQVIYGNKLGAHVSGEPQELGVPATVSDLEEFKIDYRYTETGDAERNLAFESFFHTNCNIGGPNFVVDNREYELMVWIANPTIRTPGSTKAESGVMIDNQLWDVWIKPLQDKSYIAFTAVNELTQGSLNWNRFIDWTVDWSATNESVYGIDQLDTNWCMAGIEFGVETWWGAATLTLDELKITRQ